MDSIGQIHDRMPVVVPSDMVADWLDPTISQAEELLSAIPDPWLVTTEKSPA